MLNLYATKHRTLFSQTPQSEMWIFHFPHFHPSNRSIINLIKMTWNLGKFPGICFSQLIDPGTISFFPQARVQCKYSEEFVRMAFFPSDNFTPLVQLLASMRVAVVVALNFVCIHSILTVCKCPMLFPWQCISQFGPLNDVAFHRQVRVLEPEHCAKRTRPALE